MKNQMNTDKILRAARALPGHPSFLQGFMVDHEWQRLKVFEPTAEDGARAILWVHRMPAEFWRVTVGDIEITTGSGDEMGRLMIQLAEAIANGMVGIGGLRETRP